MIENTMEFGKDLDNYAIINFADGRKSLPLYSKMDAFDELVELLKTKGINKEEFDFMLNQVFNKEELPWNIVTGKNEILIEIIGLMMSGLPFGFPYSSHPGFPMVLISILGKATEPKKEEVISYPSFIQCPEESNHGHIVTKKGHTAPLTSKEEAIEKLEILIRHKIIAEEDRSKVEEQINKFFAPETVPTG